MSAEKAALKPAVQAILAGVSGREVLRKFGGKLSKLRKQVLLVKPDFVSPFAKHGQKLTRKGSIPTENTHFQGELTL